MKLFVLGSLIIVLFAVTEGCAAAQQPGTTSESINVGGVQRTYLLHRPTAYDNSTTYPLVFVLHGLGGNAKGIETATGMSVKADAEKFIRRVSEWTRQSVRLGQRHRYR
jgi:polyhydroxybutyrate depolymerase